MFRFIIDIFCKDTVIGLHNFSETDVIDDQQLSEDNNLRLYKNFYYSLFNSEDLKNKKFKDSFTDPIAYHLSEVFQNQKALYSE